MSLFYQLASSVNVSAGGSDSFEQILPEPIEAKDVVVGYKIEPSGTPTTLGYTKVSVDIGSGYRRIAWIEHETYNVEGTLSIPDVTEKIKVEVENGDQDTAVTVSFEVRGIDR